MSEPILEIREVHTYYGHVHALKGISLSIEPGEIVALIGANGAGKTTTLRTVSGLLRPRDGDILINGKSMKGDPRARNRLHGGFACARRPQDLLHLDGQRKPQHGRLHPE